MKRIVLFAMLIASIGLHAQTTHTVINTNDAGLGSLRAAADSAVAGDTIRFDSSLIALGSDTINLTTGEISFDSNGVVIKGLYTATDTLCISGNNNSRIFSFTEAGRVVLDSLVLINGNTSGSGGGVYRYNCFDTLFVANSTISGNTSTSSGGGIYSASSFPYSSYITVTNSIISGNAAVSGAGIHSYSSSSSSVAIINSTISENTDPSSSSSSSGGGILSYGSSSSVLVVNSTISENSATYGGGINSSSSGSSTSYSVSIINSTISGNVAAYGGGIDSFPYSVLVMNSTISNNTASSSGGGIYAKFNYNTISDSVYVSNSTISGNTAYGDGGGIVSFSSASSFNSCSSSVIIKNSTVSGNTSTVGDGGGIMSYASYSYTYASSGSSSTASVSVANSTISGNASYAGGGIYSYASSTAGSVSWSNCSSSSSVTLTNSTISGNTATVYGDGIYSYSYSSTSPTYSPSSITVTSSIIAENDSNSSGIYNNGAPIITSNGYNIFSDSPTGAIGSDSTNITALQLDLEALAFNGGSTQTMRPGIGGIAINNGNPNDISDAQNVPILGIRDVGAAEYCAQTFFTDTVSSCGSYYTWIDGNTYTLNNNVATYTINNAAGCDSLITLNLTLYSTATTDTVHACDSIVWINGQTYYPNPGIVSDTFANVLGCDSVVFLHFIPSNYGVDNRVVCDSLTWINGVTYYTSNNTVTDTLTSSFGCDSVVTLDLTVNTTQYANDVITACVSYTWNGVTYYSNNNVAKDTLISIAGCDSIVTLDLTILQPSSGTAIISACDSYTWNGIVYTSNNNTALDTLVNIAGCDSIVTLDLTILNSSTFVDTITSCSSISWIDGITYTNSNNTATHIIPNAVGCDSVVTLDFTLLVVNTSVTRNDLTLTAQASNATYQWMDCLNGSMTGEMNASFTATISGDYQVEITQNGCIDTSACFAITNVGVQETELIGVRLYPNPTSDVLYINKGSNGPLKITITNSVGAVVHQSTSKNQITTIDMANMATGIYVVTLKNELGMKVEKVVKR